VFELHPHGGQWERYATFDPATGTKPPTEDKSAIRKPYEDLGAPVGLARKGRRLAFWMIAIDGVGANTVVALTYRLELNLKFRGVRP
jgi:hypothetical protein